jgi:tellurite resistance protein TerC
MPANWIFWLGFLLFVVMALALDLCVFHRRSRVMSFGQAMGLTSFWVGLAFLFAVTLWFFGGVMTGQGGSGHARALEFVTGYLIEESLSVDNLFIFLLIFRFFRVPGEYQHKVLGWGIIGALLLRGVFIVAGVALITRFHFLFYFFGAFLLYAAGKLLFGGGAKEVKMEDNRIARWVRSVVRMTPEYEGERFWIKRRGLFYFTPLFLVLVVIETTDLMFATDSIPAILAITQDPFIVFTSNVFAILGLRAVYFALAGMMGRFYLLHYGLAAILAFIGVKMLIAHFVTIPTVVALGCVILVLALSVVASRIFPQKQEKRRVP